MNLIRSQVHAVAAARGVGDGGASRVLSEAGPGQPDHSIDGNVTQWKYNLFKRESDFIK